MALKTLLHGINHITLKFVGCILFDEINPS